ncbi:MbtH family protein [Streptomyces sp. FXJ1.172]|uniref:MbtH family protein n=1 Tax=Streptomyces sp. FXJ1.172 TaxID=710705 RepID=UPI0007CF2EB9|nr:MbtH family protein [Streptomyces sp. FXJ1.172]WEO95419.1 MbtH family protein [Streptomyces sp. FXJ1.172]
MENSAEDATEHVVVVNAEEQYSVWPAHRDVPEGWRALDVRGTKTECLDHIERTWTDMRPLSLRSR